MSAQRLLVPNAGAKVGANAGANAGRVTLCGAIPRLAETRPIPPFGTILADNPWRWKAWGPAGEHRSPKYHRMEVADLYALPVASLAAPDCVLHLWVLDTMLIEGIYCGIQWGFDYKKVGYTWGKVGADGRPAMSTGYITRNAMELCLCFTRGQPQRQSRSECQLILRQRGEHSAKPEAFQDSMERLYPGPYCELFARRQRDKWVTVGNEVTGRDVRHDIQILQRRVATYQALREEQAVSRLTDRQRILPRAAESIGGASLPRPGTYGAL